MKTTLAHQLADYTCALRFEDLSKEVVHEVKRRVIDSLGCAFGAWKEEPFVIARKVAADLSAKHGSTIFGTDHKAPPDWAAFANGCGIRYFDFNDTYLSKEPAHPSDNISAALAVAESMGAGGRELITAIAIAPRADIAHRMQRFIVTLLSIGQSLRTRQSSARFGWPM